MDYGIILDKNGVAFPNKSVTIEQNFRRNLKADTH
jgi:hypothetical protein